MNRKRFPVSKKYLRQQLLADEFVGPLTTGEYVALDDLKKGMTYSIYVNNCTYDDNGKVAPGMTSFYKVTGLCTETKKFAGETLYAKFNTKGNSSLIRGNYGLVYFCVQIVH